MNEATITNMSNEELIRYAENELREYVIVKELVSRLRYTDDEVEEIDSFFDTLEGVDKKFDDDICDLNDAAIYFKELLIKKNKEKEKL